MKNVTMALFLILSTQGIEKLSATPYAASDTIRIRSYVSRGDDYDLSQRKPTDFAFNAIGSLKELRRGIADSRGVDAYDIGKLYFVDAGKKIPLNDEHLFQTHILPKLRENQGKILFTLR